jgi:hypothetical protein
MTTAVPEGLLWLIVRIVFVASSYIMPSRPSFPALIFFFTSSVFISNIVDVESPALVVNPRLAFGTNATPWTRGVSLRSPSTFPVARHEHASRCWVGREVVERAIAADVVLLDLVRLRRRGARRGNGAGECGCQREQRILAHDSALEMM